jgi:hypothetical protein
MRKCQKGAKLTGSPSGPSPSSEPPQKFHRCNSASLSTERLHGLSTAQTPRKLFRGESQCCSTSILSLKFFRRVFSAFRHPSQRLLLAFYVGRVQNKYPVNQNSSLLGHNCQPGMDSREPVWPNNIKSLSWPQDGITYSYEQRGYIKPEKVACWLEKAFGQGTAKYVVRRLFTSFHRPHESYSLLNGKSRQARQLIRLPCPNFLLPSNLYDEW